MVRKYILKHPVKKLLVMVTIFFLMEGIVRLVSPSIYQVPMDILVRNLEIFDSGPFKQMDWTKVIRWDGVSELYNVYQEDVDLGFRMKSNHTQDMYIYFSPFKTDKTPTFKVKLNSHGYRDLEYPVIKPINTYRVICMGDSSTFGACVESHQTYPHVLERLLRKKYPLARIQVFNFGVLGYTSEQGRILLDKEVWLHKPDFITVSYGFNDWTFGTCPDKDLLAKKRENAIITKLKNFMHRSKFIKFVDSVMVRIKFEWIKYRASKRPFKLNMKNLPFFSKLVKNYKGLQYKVSLERFRENMVYFRDSARKRHVGVVFAIPHVDPFKLMNIFPPGKIKPYKVLTEMYKNGEIDLVRLGDSKKELAKIKQIPFLRKKTRKIKSKLRNEFKNNNNWIFKSDIFHPNEIANHLIAKKLLKKIEEDPGFNRFLASHTWYNKDK